MTSLEAFKVYLNVHFAVSDALLKKKSESKRSQASSVLTKRYTRAEDNALTRKSPCLQLLAVEVFYIF